LRECGGFIEVGEEAAQILVRNLDVAGKAGHAP
jgi:hypothetical protein